MCTFDDPGTSKHHQKTTRRHPERHKKSEMVAGEEKKARNFGPPSIRGPTLRGPTLRGLTGVNSSMLYFHLVVLFFFLKAKTLKH